MFTYISCIPQLVPQDLNNSKKPRLSCTQVLWKTYLRSRCLRWKWLLGFDWTYVCVHQKRVNIKSAITIAATMTPCWNALLAANRIHFALTVFVQALLQERFTSKWWLRSKVVAKNKLKTCRYYESRHFICLHKSEHNCWGNKHQTNIHWCNMLWKQGALNI